MSETSESSVLPLLCALCIGLGYGLDKLAIPSLSLGLLAGALFVDALQQRRRSFVAQLQARLPCPRRRVASSPAYLHTAFRDRATFHIAPPDNTPTPTTPTSSDSAALTPEARPGERNSHLPTP